MITLKDLWDILTGNMIIVDAPPRVCACACPCNEHAKHQEEEDETQICEG